MVFRGFGFVDGRVFSFPLRDGSAGRGPFWGDSGACFGVISGDFGPFPFADSAFFLSPDGFLFVHFIYFCVECDFVFAGGLRLDLLVACPISLFCGV